MKEGWENKKLSEICGFVRGPFGGSLKKNIFRLDGYAVYEQQHAIYDQFDDIRYFIDETKFNEMKRFVLNSGDLIMSCSGTMGKIAIVPANIKEGIINQALLKLTPSKKVDTVYLKLWLESDSFQESINKHSGGAAIQNVASVAILKQIEIQLPPLPEQQRIVSIIDEAFEAIDKAIENTQKNLQNAKELFESYLNSVFENGGEGWEIKTLSEVCEISAGGDVPKDNFDINKSEKFQIPIYANGEKYNGLYGYTNIPKITKPSITVSARGTIGFAVRRLEAFYPVVRLIVITPKDSTDVCLDFLFYTIQIMDFKHSGTSIPQLTVPMIRSYKIPFPPLFEQQNIVQKLDDLSAVTQKLEKQYQQKLRDLEELKKSILNKAFAGEI